MLENKPQAVSLAAENAGSRAGHEKEAGQWGRGRELAVAHLRRE